jgi:MFS family permease
VVTDGIVGFAVSSLLCGLTPTNSLAEVWIIVFRIAQRVSAAFVVPAALAVVNSSFALPERGKALAIFVGVSGAFTAIVPIAGGYLTPWAWRSIFWINIPIASTASCFWLEVRAPSVSDTSNWKTGGPANQQRAAPLSLGERRGGVAGPADRHQPPKTHSQSRNVGSCPSICPVVGASSALARVPAG